MIELPDFSKSFVYENNFYLSCDSTRMSKILAHYELYKMVQDLPGAIVECGVFKGASLARFAMFRDVFSNNYSKKIIGFDIFGPFPETKFELDKKQRKNFIQEAGSESIGTEQLMQVFKHKNIDRNIELIKGDSRIKDIEFSRPMSFEDGIEWEKPEIKEDIEDDES